MDVNKATKYKAKI